MVPFHMAVAAEVLIKDLLHQIVVVPPPSPACLTLYFLLPHTHRKPRALVLVETLKSCQAQFPLCFGTRLHMSEQ